MLIMNFQYNIFFFFKNLSLTNTISFLKYDHPSFNYIMQGLFFLNLKKKSSPYLSLLGGLYSDLIIMIYQMLSSGSI